MSGNTQEPKLQQVARLAGVSISTASRTFTGAPGVGKETRSRVLAAARKLGYEPRSRTMESAAVGFIVTPSRLLPHSTIPERTVVRGWTAAQADLRDHVRHDVLPVGSHWRVYALVPVTIRRSGES